MDFKSEKVSRSSDTNLGGDLRLENPNSFSISEIAPWRCKTTTTPDVVNEEQSRLLNYTNA